MSVGIGLVGAGRMGQVFAHTLAFSVAEAVSYTHLTLPTIYSV